MSGYQINPIERFFAQIGFKIIAFIIILLIASLIGMCIKACRKSCCNKNEKLPEVVSEVTVLPPDDAYPKQVYR
ncbi:hypothetical protein JTE90_005142 [Oedothorax gibbosus]|uniref:Uncharacterized protein n=1 Tax=Oedothorax gibbosus TaxID=931172 RepID=A0AAV6UN21_9ARAC|nr:hypothetical protein JTE90_005142 [Oedothorax gibbosus]